MKEKDTTRDYPFAPGGWGSLKAVTTILAQAHGLAAPINATLVKLIHQAERAPREWRANELLQELQHRLAPL